MLALGLGGAPAGGCGDDGGGDGQDATGSATGSTTGPSAEATTGASAATGSESSGNADSTTGGNNSSGTDSGDTTTGGDSGSDGGTTTGGSDGGTTGKLDDSMSFFVTSTALTGTGDLGGLAGADAHCQALASAAGSTTMGWVAYLSTEGGPGPGDDVNAIDRIGAGPWFNADGAMFAADLDSIHTIEPDIIACDGAAPPGCLAARAAYILLKPADELFLDENGVQITDPLQPENLPVPNGGDRGHDIFTGSLPDGTVFPGGTCNDWTSAAPSELARVGHTDVPVNTQFSPSWNSAHDTVSCTLGGVESRGGAGFFYCFAPT